MAALEAERFLEAEGEVDEEAAAQQTAPMANGTAEAKKPELVAA